METLLKCVFAVRSLGLEIWRKTFFKKKLLCDQVGLLETSKQTDNR